MKRTIANLLLLLVVTFCYGQKQEVRLPLTFHNELGKNSTHGFAIQGHKAVSDTCSIAKSCKVLKDKRMGEIEIYPTASFNGWDRTYRNKVRFIMGVDSNGKKQIMFDTNNNADFNDEVIFVVDTLNDNNKFSFEKLSKVKVDYDWAIQGKKVKRELSLHIFYRPEINMYIYTFAHHATATLNEKKLEIIPVNNLEYLNFEIFDLSNNSSEGIKANKYLTDNNKVYRVKEVDINSNELVLEKEKRKLSEIESAQIGFRPPAFAATDVITKEMVSLEKYKGKYVFLDLFTTWCGPCIKELPEIKKVYDQVDRSKIEFIGIIGEDKPERIAKIISNSGLNWRLIEANSDNNIFNKYKVNAFPTTLLIDPKGIIIKSGFRAEELKRFIDNGFKETIEKDVKL